MPANARGGGESIRYGLFLQSSHPPERALGDAIERVVEQIRWADALGFAEAWVGEHLTAVWEPIPAQDLVLAQAIACTSEIRLCAGAYVLPFYHPAALALRVAQLDHMARGRFVCGVAAGSIFTFSLTLGDYIIPQLIGSSRPFIGQAVYQLQGTAGDVPMAAAFAMAPIVIMAVYLTIAKRFGAFDAL